ncbi:helix-turn-helix domain-containing protein [Lacticaseibacillus nasuensis]|uniref:helix-turn-helix domain-containing protein n=1 Tax=Lacticaseibacillus nasuensis TaxID=944671 RepID=UPI000A4DC3EF
MPRHKLTAFELKLRETISANLKKVSGSISQQQLSDMTGIPASTISGYFSKRSTPNPGSIQKKSPMH